MGFSFYYEWLGSALKDPLVLWNPKISYSGFVFVTQGKTTIDDVLAVDPSTQIYTNIFESDSNRFVTGDDIAIFSTNHYLIDGILTIGYKYNDGKLVVDGTSYSSDFQVHVHTANKILSGKVANRDLLYEAAGNLQESYTLPAE